MPRDAAPVDGYVLRTSGRWEWVNGSPIRDRTGDYGIRGLPAPSNRPGGRDNGAAWLVGDQLWLLGGQAFGGGGQQDNANDLWRYDLATDMWTWMAGATDGGTPSYGALGVPSATVVPGGRNDSHGYVDDGGLWLFGGSGYDPTTNKGPLGDWWRYDIALGQWAWIGGSSMIGSAASYGTRGVESATNDPGSRASGGQWQIGTSFYVFGGERGPNAFLQDMWRFDTATRRWTWIAGETTMNGAPVYGTKHQFASSNTPGARAAGCSWTTPLGLWLYGGEIGVAGQYRGDLWLFDLGRNEWAWQSGDQVTSAPAVHGSLGQGDATTKPGGRSLMMCWADAYGNLWLFGGKGNADPDMYSDLWVYSPVLDVWTHVAGPTQLALAGSWMAGGHPGARGQGGWWRTADDTFWLFGGDFAIDANGELGEMSDLWRFVPQ